MKIILLLSGMVFFLVTCNKKSDEFNFERQEDYDEKDLNQNKVPAKDKEYIKQSTPKS